MAEMERGRAESEAGELETARRESDVHLVELETARRESDVHLGELQVARRESEVQLGELEEARREIDRLTVMKEELKRLKEERGYKPDMDTLPNDLASLATQDYSPRNSCHASPREEPMSEDYLSDSDVDLLNNETVNHSIADIIKHLQPNKKAELQRYSVLSFLKCLVRKLGAQVYPHGSYALKTYLPEDEVDVSAFFSRASESTWVQRVVNALCQEAAAETDVTTRAPTQFAVQKVTAIFSEERPVIQCRIGLVSVNIYGNNVGALARCSLHEFVDIQVGQDHLYKRSLILVQAWASNVGILDSNQEDGMLPAVFIHAIVLYIFNAYHADITTPLQALFKLLAYLKTFEWDEHALSMYGPVMLCSLGIPGQAKLESVSTGPSAFPIDAVPLINNVTLRKFTSCPSKLASSKSGGAEFLQPPEPQGRTASGSTPGSKSFLAGTESPDHGSDQDGWDDGDGGDDMESVAETYDMGSSASFSRCSLNVIDPIDPSNNLGMTVSYKHQFRVRRVFRDGVIRLRKALRKSTDMALEPLSRAAESSIQFAKQLEREVLDCRLLESIFDEALRRKYIEEQCRQRRRESKPLSIYSLAQMDKSNIAAAACGDGIGDAAATLAIAAQEESRPVSITAPATVETKKVVFDTSSLSNLATIFAAASTADVTTTTADADYSTDTSSTNSATTSATASANTSAATSLEPNSIINVTPSEPIDDLSGAGKRNDMLDGNLNLMIQSLEHARQFERPDISEEMITEMLVKIIQVFTLTTSHPLSMRTYCTVRPHAHALSLPRSEARFQWGGSVPFSTI
jgi:hypothetical protein